MKPNLRPRRPLGLCLPLLVLAACASSAKESETSVDWNLHHMQYERAAELAAKNAAEHPDDPQAAQAHRRASVALLLERGRRQTLEDNDVEALRIFQQALMIDQESPELLSWIDKTQKKLSDRWLQIALEAHSSGKLEAAVDAYEQSLRFQPGYEIALSGMDQAVREVNHREMLSQKYFNEGIHALSDYWLESARSRFDYSNKYKPGEEHTSDRSKQVKLLLAQQRARVAQEFEKIRLYGAARNEYRMALALAPDDPPSRAALERCTREVQAQHKLEDATYQIMRGQYERAAKLLDEGEELTLAQKDLFEGTRARIQEQQHENLYDEALALERDQRYPEAIEKYEQLLASAQYYKDVFARRDTLKQYIQLSADLYERAQAATDDKTKLDLLRQIAVFWPEYKDLETLIPELEQKLGG